jgi:glutamine synthetase
MEPIEGYTIYLIICATYDINNNPLPNNHFHLANEYFNMKQDEVPWFGLEQEYFFIQNNTLLGIKPSLDIIDNKKKYYCNTINQHTLGEKVALYHMNSCLKAGINISGINAEVVCGQWEFQVGPCVGIEAGNHMMAARFLLEKIAIREGLQIDFHPKPFINMNGSGCHVNFSTKKMREDNGYEVILDAVNKLELTHSYHMENYGEFNNMRMTGKHETASYDKFTWGIGTRNTSVRIGNDTFKNKKGYFEDRRPASNIDPYLVTSLIYKTCCL